MRKCRRSGNCSREPRVPRVGERVVGQDVLGDARRSCRPSPGRAAPRRPRPATGTSRRRCGRRRTATRAGPRRMRIEHAEQRRASHAGSSTMPCEPSGVPSLRAGSRWPGPPGADVDRVPSAWRFRDHQPAAHVVGDAPAPRARPPADPPCMSQTAFWIACTSESCPRFGHPWCMSSSARSTMRASAGGRSPGCSTRTKSSPPTGACAGHAGEAGLGTVARAMLAVERHGSPTAYLLPPAARHHRSDTSDRRHDEGRHLPAAGGDVGEARRAEAREEPGDLAAEDVGREVDQHVLERHARAGRAGRSGTPRGAPRCAAARSTRRRTSRPARWPRPSPRRTSPTRASRPSRRTRRWA